MATPLTPGLPQTEEAAQALFVLLRPVARLMIDHGVTLPTAVEWLKQALIDEALDSFAVDAGGSSDTRVSLLTGVHRKDVRRLRDSPLSPTNATPTPPVAALVVGLWISDPAFLCADRQPLPLARTPSKAQPEQPGFTELVRKVSRDHSPRAVLDELVRLGVATVDSQDHVRLNQPGFVPQAGQAEGLTFLGQHVSDHLSAAVHNNSPTRNTPQMLDQSVFSNGLSPAQVDALHALARDQWHDQMVTFLQAATQAEARSAGDTGPRYRIRLGTYFWLEPEGSARATETSPHARQKRPHDT